MNLELPRINENYDGKEYQFCYGFQLDATRQFKVTKVDLHTKEIISWEEPGYFLGEPVFLPTPLSQSEDEGVILVLGSSDANQNSILVILNAKNMQEIGRAEIPYVIPEGIHGRYFS